MRYFISILLIYLLHNCLYAQSTNTALAGKWQFINYSPNIIKATFTPAGYTTNENITDAVIATPIGSNKIPVINKANNINIGVSPQINIQPTIELEGYKGFSITLAPDEKIYGGGERALPLNRRGYQFNLYNNPWYGYSNGADNLNFSVPFFTSNKGYGLFFDNGSKGIADIGKTKPNTFQVGFVSGELNVYIIFGNTNAEILQGFHTLTGNQPLPPKWVLGNFMSRFGYASDLFWFGDSIKGTLGNLEWVNKKQWPNPKKMLQKFNQQNIKSVLIAEPFVLQGTKQFSNATKFLATDSAGKPFMLQDFYFGIGGVFDIFRKDAADWIWKNHYQKQLANGATGWWTDLGEPEKHPKNLFHSLTSAKYKRLFGADEVHNVFGHYWNKMLSEKYAQYLPNQRLFHLNRSGFAGSQRYSIFPWSGDVSRSWDGFAAQLPIMLGMSMSGIPYIHADAGGFAGGEGDKELYVRWLQFASFTPIFRPHGTALGNIDPIAFNFASEPALIDEPYKTYVKAAIQMRYALLPYNYTLAYQQTTNSAPLVAPLYYYYPSDTTASNIENEFMWGSQILVAPIIKKGVAEQKIYLPQGNWYKLNTTIDEISNNTTYTNWITEPLTLQQIPVFIKAGSFLPIIQKAPGLNTTYYTSDTLIVHYFSDTKSSSYTLYEDDGKDKKAIANKQYELINFKAISSSSGVNFSITSNQGKFLGKPLKRVIQLIVHGNESSNKKMVSKNTTIVNSQKSNCLQSSFTFTGQPILIQLQ
jgi:oligosaccharide 4-alpha-D-glucosyltransferase